MRNGGAEMVTLKPVEAGQSMTLTGKMARNVSRTYTARTAVAVKRGA